MKRSSKANVCSSGVSRNLVSVNAYRKPPVSKPVWFVLSAGPIVSALVGMASGGTESPWTRLEEALILESKYQPSLQLPITTEVRFVPCPAPLC